MNTWRRAAILGSVVTIFFVMGLLAWSYRSDPALKDFFTIIGLPFAFIAAFVVVAFFRKKEPPVEFQAFGLKLWGAAAEIVLWILCFLAITGAMAFLWKG